MPPYFVDSVGSIYMEAPDRRGRSAATFTFKNQSYGTPIKTGDPTDFRLAIVDEVYRVLHREDNDPVYRGDMSFYMAIVFLD
jgi:hypothetical protein